MFRAIRGILFFLLVVPGAFASWFFSCISILLMPIPFKSVIAFRRNYIRFFTGVFLDYASSILIFYCGTKVYIYSNDNSILNDTGHVVISNHKTRIDWMFVGWCYNIFSRVRNEKCHVILKESLKSIPIFGWTMQMMLYIFLERDRTQDIPHISRSLKYLREHDPDTSLLLFPEGTDLCDSNLEKSHKCK